MDAEGQQPSAAPVATPPVASSAITQRLVAGETSAPDFSCKGINLERYTIGSVTLRAPIEVPWFLNGTAKAQQHLQTALVGQKFTYTGSVTDELQKLRGSSTIPFGAAGAFRISVAFIVATRCDPHSLKVDLTYNIYTIPPSSLMSGTPEWNARAREAPEDATGLTTGSNPFHFIPQASFAGWKQLYSGGHLSWKGKDFSLLADGAASASEYQGSLAVYGSRNTLGPIAQWDWRLNGAVASHPVAGGHLAQNQFSGQMTAATRAFSGGNLMARFGGQIEGGGLRSSLVLARIPAGTIAGGTYVSSRFYAGLTSRATHNVFSLSVGTELGFLQSSTGHWRKIVTDVTDDFWISAPNHYPVEFETRFTAGAIPSFENIPAGARFYGGSAVVPFMPGDTWQMNSGPRIRAIPAGQFGFTSGGPGATSFGSFNLTVSRPVWMKPLVPIVVGSEIEPLIEGQLGTAKSLLQNSYAGDDPRVPQMIDLATSLGPLLDNLTAALASAQAANPSLPAAPFDACGDPIPVKSIIVAALATESNKYATAKSMPAQMAEIAMACSLLLSQKPVDPGVFKATKDISDVSDKIAKLDQTFQASAEKKADDATRFARRAIRSVVNDFNIVSIAPLVVADWARIGPPANGIKTTRFGPGAGIRIELATFVNLTAGVAFNVHPQPGEGARAFFFSIGFRDILH